MTTRATTRSIVCAVLVLCLCATVFSIGAPAGHRDRASEFRALAAPAGMVLFTRGGARHDPARQRPSAPFLLALVPLHGGKSDPEGHAGAIERRAPRSLWTAGPRTGRSPPAIS